MGRLREKENKDKWITFHQEEQNQLGSDGERLSLGKDKWHCFFLDIGTEYPGDGPLWQFFPFFWTWLVWCPMLCLTDWHFSHSNDNCIYPPLLIITANMVQRLTQTMDSAFLWLYSPAQWNFLRFLEISNFKLHNTKLTCLGYNI